MLFNNGQNIQNFDPDFNYIKNLSNIGTHLSDFLEIPKGQSPYTLLGKGNFGYAEKMQSKLNKKYYAIKKLNKNSLNFNKKDFIRETQIMIKLNHENIIKIIWIF